MICEYRLSTSNCDTISTMLPIFLSPRSSAESLSRRGIWSKDSSSISVVNSRVSTAISCWYFFAFTIGDDKSAPTRYTITIRATTPSITFSPFDSFSSYLFRFFFLIKISAARMPSTNRNTQNSVEWMLTGGRAA